MRKYILFVIFAGACSISAGAIVSLFLFPAYFGFKWYWEFGPVLALAFGIKTIIEVLAAIKTARKIDKVLIDADETIRDLQEFNENSKERREELKKLHGENLDKAMSLLLKTGDILTANQKEMWALVQKNVPHDDPLKMKLKKKFFTCEYEDLLNPIC